MAPPGDKAGLRLEAGRQQCTHELGPAPTAETAAVRPAQFLQHGFQPGNIEGSAKAWITPAVPMESEKDKFGAGEVGLLDIARIADKGVGALMGKAWRNPITGEVQIKQFGMFQDFQVADLWTRYGLNGTTEQLARDPYLFRPIPMNMRTWIYHHLFRAGHVLSGVSGAEEDAMMRYVLGLHCIDALKAGGGKWAPIMLYVPMILFLCVAADINATFAAIAVLALQLFIYWILNTPHFYRICRLITLPLRVAFIYWLIMRMAARGGEEDAAVSTTLGFIIALLICFFEIIWGDGGSLCAYRLHCSYEVIRALPNRIFICRRHGAAHSQDIVGSRTQVNEKITGMGCWQEDFALIADVKGLIVELRPMGVEDWKLVYREKQSNTSMQHYYIGLDVYSPGAATIDALNAAIDESKMMAMKNQMKRDWSKMDVEEA